MVRWAYSGTHQGEFLGAAPTGRPVKGTGTSTLRFAGGKVEEAWDNWDALGMMQQLGVVPEPGQSEQNKAIVRRYIEEVFNKGDLSLVDDIFASDIVFGGNHLPEIRDVEGIRQFVTAARTAIPDLHAATDDLIAEADKVVLRWTITGAHEGEWMGVAPTGKQLKVTGTATWRLAGGKIKEHWADWDVLGQMQQLGAVSQMEQAKGETAG